MKQDLADLGNRGRTGRALVLGLLGLGLVGCGAPAAALSHAVALRSQRPVSAPSTHQTGTDTTLGSLQSSSASTPTRPETPVASIAPSPIGTVTVNGRRLALPGPAPLGEVLAAAHVVAAPGHLLDARTHAPLQSVVSAPTLLVNGAVASLATVVPERAVIFARSGTDEVEATETVRVPAPLDVPFGVYVGGSAGTDLVTRGVVSHQVLSRVHQIPASPGRLRHGGTVALTFDDGPDPAWTPQVLALLAQHHVHATFCLIGSRAVRYPGLVEAIVAGGHRLCDHTMDHDEQLAHRPLAQIEHDIDDAAKAIATASGGVKPVYFRAPGGNFSPTIDEVATRAHLQKLAWTVDPRDWSLPGVPAIVDTVWQELRPGGIVLLHDGGGPRAESVQALRLLLDELAQAGYSYRLP